MTTANIRKIALNTLRVASENVRKINASAASDTELKASIRAHGVLQNLSVYDGKDGCFYVHAGGRRLKALQELAIEGAIEADAKIGCVVKDVKDAAELSLAENLMRAAMNPADEFDAFAALIDQGRTEDEVAERFGVTILHVRKRMKLAGIAPQIVDQFRAGTITQEALMAFTLSDSHERQMEVWQKVEPQLRWGAAQVPHLVKRLMNETRVSAGTKLGRFVGIERYTAAGGTLVADLFSSTDETYLENPALLESLAVDLLAEAAKSFAAEWKWTDTALEVPYDTLAGYGRVYPQGRALPDHLDAEMMDISERLAAFEAFDGEPSDAEHAEWHALERRYSEIENEALPYFPAEVMALAGVIVTIDHMGELKVEAGLVRPEDMQALTDLNKAQQQAAAQAAGLKAEAAHIDGVADDEADADAGASDDDTSAEAETERAAPVSTFRPMQIQAPRNYKPAKSEEEQETGPSMSAALVSDLRAIRHQVFQANLASDFAVAFDLMLFSMCHTAFSQGYVRKPIDLSMTVAHTYASAEHRKGTVSEKILEALKANLRLEWMTLPKAEQFAAMCELSAEEKQALFAFTASHGVQQQLATDSDPIPGIEAAGARMNIAVEDYWRPTAANYFGRVKKDVLLDTARETIDAQWAHDHSGGKKAEFAKTMEVAFGADARQRIGLDADAAERTAAWLPAGMAFRGVDEAALATDETPIAAEVVDDADEATSDSDNVVALPAFLLGGEEDAEAPSTAQDFIAEGYDLDMAHFNVAAE